MVSSVRVCVGRGRDSCNEYGAAVVCIQAQAQPEPPHRQQRKQGQLQEQGGSHLVHEHASNNAVGGPHVALARLICLGRVLVVDRKHIVLRPCANSSHVQEHGRACHACACLCMHMWPSAHASALARPRTPCQHARAACETLMRAVCAFEHANASARTTSALARHTGTWPTCAGSVWDTIGL